MGFLHVIGLVLLQCIAPDGKGVLSLTCGERICGYGSEDVCHSEMCRCKDGFKRTQPSTMYPDVDICLEICNWKITKWCSSGSWCANKTTILGLDLLGDGVCLCSKGYYRTSTGKCVDADTCEQANNCMEQSTCKDATGEKECPCMKDFEWDGIACRPKDIDECEQKPSVCGEHSRCENLPGNYSCHCLKGFTSNLDGNFKCVPDELVERTDPTTDGATIGLYVGVTLGVLVLLIVVFVALFIRRRRKSRKSEEGQVELSLRHSVENSDHPELPSDNRHDKTLSVEYSNAQIPQNKLDRRQNVVSVKYSNNEILPKSERNEDKAVSNQSEGEGVNDDYDNLDSCNLNRPVNIKVGDITVEGDNPYNTLYTEKPILPNSERNENKSVSNQSEGEGAYSAPYEEKVPTYNDDYNTLDSCNLNRAVNITVDDITVEGDNPYNTLYTEIPILPVSNQSEGEGTYSAPCEGKVPTDIDDYDNC